MDKEFKKASELERLQLVLKLGAGKMGIAPMATTESESIVGMSFIPLDEQRIPGSMIELTDAELDKGPVALMVFESREVVDSMINLLEIIRENVPPVGTSSDGLVN